MRRPVTSLATGAQPLPCELDIYRGLVEVELPYGLGFCTVDPGEIAELRGKLPTSALSREAKRLMTEILDAAEAARPA